MIQKQRKRYCRPPRELQPWQMQQRQRQQGGGGVVGGGSDWIRLLTLLAALSRMDVSPLYYAARPFVARPSLPRAVRAH